MQPELHVQLLWGRLLLLLTNPHPIFHSTVLPPLPQPLPNSLNNPLLALPHQKRPQPLTSKRLVQCEASQLGPCALFACKGGRDG